MATDETLDLVVSSFPSPAGANLVLAALVNGGGEALQGVKELATVRRGEDTRLHIDESNDMSAAGAASGGGTLGLLIGLLGGPLGLIIGGVTGAVIGGIAGKLIDTGIPDARLREIGALLAPNTSAIVAFVEPAQAQQLRDALAQGGGTTLSQTIPAAVSQHLAAARDEAAQDTSAPSASSPVITASPATPRDPSDTPAA